SHGRRSHEPIGNSWRWNLSTDHNKRSINCYDQNRSFISISHKLSKFRGPLQPCYIDIMKNSIKTTAIYVAITVLIGSLGATGCAVFVPADSVAPTPPPQVILQPPAQVIVQPPAQVIVQPPPAAETPPPPPTTTTGTSTDR